MAQVKSKFQDAQDERICLAALLKKPEFIVNLDKWSLKPAAFSYKIHQTIYSSILLLYNEKGSLDIYILSNKLKSHGISVVNDISILEYLEMLDSIQVTENHYPEYFENLAKWYYLRETEKKLQEYQEKLWENRQKPLSDIVNFVEKASSDVSTISVSSLDTDFVDLWADGERIIKEIADQDTPMGIFSPFKTYNDMYGMLTFGDAYVFAAQKKTGKSTFLAYWASNLAKQPNTKCLYFDTEMESWRVVCRNVASEAGEKEIYFRNGKFKDDKTKVSKAQRVFDEWGKMPGKLYHVYAARKSIQEVEAIVKRFHARHIKPGENLVVIYDYAKITTEISENKQEWLLMGEKMNALKELASALPRTVVLTAVQLNEQDKIAASARISWFASSTFFLKRKTPEQLQRHGLEFGNMVLEEYVVRSQGEFYDEWVEIKQGSESRFIKNAINLNSLNFKIDDLGTYKEMIKTIEKRGGQLALADSKKKNYGKIAEEFNDF